MTNSSLRNVMFKRMRGIREMPSVSEARPCETGLKLNAIDVPRPASPRSSLPFGENHVWETTRTQHLCNLIDWREVALPLKVGLQITPLHSYMLRGVLGRTKRNRMGNFLGAHSAQIETNDRTWDPRFPFSSLVLFKSVLTNVR